METGASPGTVLSVEQFLALHPWPKEHAATKRLEWLWHFDLGASVDEVWAVVSDSSRMNHALGVSEMKFEEREGKRWGTSRPGGVHHEWVEVPWNWVAGQWLESVRLYQAGFSKVVFGVFRLEPLGTGTRVYIYFGAVPRGPIGWLALRFGFPPLQEGYRKVLPAAAVKAPLGFRPRVLLLATAKLSPEADARLTQASAALTARGLDAGCIAKLADWIRTGDEQDLYRIQVRERARAWSVDEDALLRVCLHATRAGLLGLSWDTVCPHCRGVVEESAHLGSLTAQAACKVCGIDFGTDAAEAVEITFHVHPSIREIARRTFCSAEPATKDHIRVQRALPPGVQEELAPKLAPGRYRLRVQGEKRYGALDVASGAEPKLEWPASAGAGEHAVTAAPAVKLINDSNAERTFIIEAAHWSDLALRPGQLLSFQEFRDLFSDEYLAAEVQLAIGEQTILFTDMVGSTAMYAKRGDPSAFAEVKRHFTEVFAIIGKHRGAVVKTIGDAAMAAFNHPLDAIKASQELHRCFHPDRTDSTTQLRISLNSGQCIAVKLNTGLDYFGHTVNIAAKLQGLAESWQVALSAAVYEGPGVAAWLAAEHAELEEITYGSKAISAPVMGKRWSVFKR